MRAGYTSHCLLLFCCLLQSATAFAEEKDVRAWLQSMVESVRTLNYRGTFVFLHDNQLESMEIFHTVDARGEKERLVSLNKPQNPKTPNHGRIREKTGVNGINYKIIN